MRAYTELAAWWPLFSPPSHYVEEAHDLLPTLLAASDSPPKTLLELGAGGGSLAYHLKRHLTLTLSDLSPQMLANSRHVNPECEHVVPSPLGTYVSKPIGHRGSGQGEPCGPHLRDVS